MKKPYLSEHSCCSKRQKFEENEDLKLQCDKLTVQMTELARKNRFYIEEAEKHKTSLAKANQTIECLEIDLKLEKQLYAKQLADVNENLSKEKSENSKLKNEFALLMQKTHTEMELRKETQWQVYKLKLDLEMENHRVWIYEKESSLKGFYTSYFSMKFIRPNLKSYGIFLFPLSRQFISR